MLEKCNKNGEIKKFGFYLRCVCKLGFVGNGIYCNDIDECKMGEVVCLVYVDCVNMLGLYNCKCYEGFEEVDMFIF